MITVYSTPTCAYCKMVKNYFRLHDIDFTDKDITKDSEAYQEILEKSGQLGVPVVDFGKEIVIGFDRVKIDTILRQSKLI